MGGRRRKIFQDFIFILKYLFLVGESWYHRWTILAFCGRSAPTLKRLIQGQKKDEEACMCWLTANRHYCTALRDWLTSG